jgi:uncharacterized membrane protein
LVDGEAQGVEDDYIKNKINEFISKIKYPFAIASLSLTILYALFYIHSYASVFNYLFLFTKALGIGISIPLLIQLIDKNNLFVKKLCSSNSPKSKVNCSSILDSPGAYFLGVFAWSEIGFVYFTSLFFYLLFVPNVHAVLLVSVLAVLAAPYTVYSIYYQWRIARRWCRLCLFVQAVLLLELLLAVIFFTAYYPYFTLVTSQAIATLALISVVILSIYSLLKPILVDWKSYKDQFSKLNKIKLDAKVFHLLLKKQRPINRTGISPIQFGNPEGNHQITIISNPSCRPCIEMHQKLFKILKTKEMYWSTRYS